MRQAVRSSVNGRKRAVNKWEHTAEMTHLSSEQFDKWGERSRKDGIQDTSDDC